MLKRYFIDEVTGTRASPRQAFSLFSQVQDWSDWCSVVRHARLFGGQWRPGAALLFVADLPRLPPAPVVVTRARQRLAALGEPQWQPGPVELSLALTLSANALEPSP